MKQFAVGSVGGNRAFFSLAEVLMAIHHRSALFQETIVAGL